MSKFFDDHEHRTMGGVGCYRPFHGLSVIVSLGITFEKHVELDGGEEIERKFAVHLESLYECE